MRKEDILHLAAEEMQQDWNDLRFQDVFYKAYIQGAMMVNAEVERITAERNAALAREAGLVAQVEALREDNKKLKERNRKLDVDLLKALFYAPSSPVSAQKAHEIEVWYGKFKQVVLAKNSGESADQYAERVKAGE